MAIITRLMIRHLIKLHVPFLCALPQYKLFETAAALKALK
jgi:hypothetical protein